MNDQNTGMNTEVPGATPAAAPAEKVKLSRRETLIQKYQRAIEKINDLQVTANELASEINSIDALASVSVGSNVLVLVGRGENVRSEPGVVLAVKDEEDGTRLYKVQYGTGFDADVAVVKAAKISVPVQNMETAAEQGAAK